MTQDIQLLGLDTDGVLTDGSILLDDNGLETKRFYARDGMGISVWLRLGFELAIVTGRTGGALPCRMKELGVRHVIQGSKDKAKALEELVERTGIEPSAMAYLGDDWNDLPILRRVGYPMAVADAEPAVLRIARHVTARPGGRGAVRDAVEHLLGRMDLMDRALGLYD